MKTLFKFFGLSLLIILLFIVYYLVFPIEANSFSCQLDLTCFAHCVDVDNNDIEYCKIKCEKCGW